MKPTNHNFSTIQILHYHANTLTEGNCNKKPAQTGLNIYWIKQMR
jgi:hypothetical protein